MSEELDLQIQDADKDPALELEEVRKELAKTKDMLTRRTKQLSKVQSSFDSVKDIPEKAGMDWDEIISVVETHQETAGNQGKLEKALEKAKKRAEDFEAKTREYETRFQDMQIKEKVHEVLNSAKVRPDRRDMAFDVVRKHFSFDEGELVGDVAEIAKSLSEKVPEWIETQGKPGFGSRPLSKGANYQPQEQLTALDLIDRGVKSGQLPFRRSTSEDNLLG